MEENRQKALQKLQERRNASLVGPSKNLNVQNSTSSTVHCLKTPSSLTPAAASGTVKQYPKSIFQNSTNQIQFQITKSSNSSSARPASSGYPNSFNANKSLQPSGMPASKSPGSFYGKAVTVTLSLISKDWFEADVNYHKQVIDIFKTVAGYRYGKLSE